MQQPLAQTVSAGHCDGSTPPAPQISVPSGHLGVPPPSGQPSDEPQFPPVPVVWVLQPSVGQLPPAQNSTHASPESPPTLF